MSRRRCEVLARDGRTPRVVRGDDGRVLRLYVDAPPPSARWLGLLDDIAVWAEPADDTDISSPGGAHDVVWIDTVALDEVGLLVGPERGDGLGLFDSPITANTGERTEAAMAGLVRVGEQRRTAVLAWIAAPPTDAADAPSGPAAPCAALKRLVADEPLDPLPALDGVPRPFEARVPARPAVPAEREDTVTQIEGFEAMIDRLEATDATASAPRAPTASDVPPVARRAPTVRIVLIVALAATVLAWGVRAVW